MTLTLVPPIMTCIIEWALRLQKTNLELIPEHFIFLGLVLVEEKLKKKKHFCSHFDVTKNKQSFFHVGILMLFLKTLTFGKKIAKKSL